MPVKAEPSHVFANRLDEFKVFPDGIRIVEAQITPAAELLCNPEVDAYSLCVTDVQISVGFGRKSRLHPALVLTLR